MAKKARKKKAPKRAAKKASSESTPQKGSNKYLLLIVGALVLVFLVLALKQAPTESPEPVSVGVAEGDTVAVKFIARFEDGTVFDTNYEDLAQEYGFDIQREVIEFEVGAGSAPAALELATFGMQVGDKKNFTMTPEQGYGQPNPNRKLEWPSNIIRDRFAKFQRHITLPRDAVSEQLGVDVTEAGMIPGKVFYSKTQNIDYIVESVTPSTITFKLNATFKENITIPQTTWKSEVRFQNSTMIHAFQMPELGDDAQTQWGEYNVTALLKRGIVLFTKLKEGERVRVNGLYGTVQNVTGDRVIFDANHPLAGKTSEWTIELVDLKKKE